ncbi:MAG: DUF5777 family beta-barrel protein [Bacteroidales bacterium]
MKSHFTIGLLSLLLAIISQKVSSQDLFELFGEEEEVTEYAFATFKTTRIVNGQSIENPPHGELKFIISHHFGRLNEGAYNLWGLDQASIRLGLEYGVTERFAISVGRSSFEKTFDGFAKYKILRQSTGAKEMPISLSVFSGIYLNSLNWRFPERTNYFSSRLSFAHQVLVARKFSNTFSFQLTPTLVHKNLVEKTEDPNDIFALGYGGRVRLTNRITFNAEYYQVLTQKTAQQFKNMLSLGFDLETGGHVFQLHFTNAQPMFERAFITETRGDWLNGDIYFGFNIVRVFTINKPEL